MHNIIIEEAKPEDAGTLVEINKISWLDTFPNEEHNITREDIEARYSNKAERVKIMENTLTQEQNDIKHTWVARDNHGIIGYCIVTKSPPPESPNEIRALFLLPEAKGSGTGRKLVETGLKWLGDDKNVSVEVTSYNKNAIAFITRWALLIQAN